MRARLVLLGLVLALAVTALPTAAATFATRGCFGDAADDVIDLATGRAADQPAADIAEWCLEHRADALVTAMRAYRPTDPGVDPVWQAGHAAVVYRFFAEDGTELVMDLGVPMDGGELTYTVFTDVRIPEVLCQGPATYIDGVWTAAAPSGTCFDAVGGLPDPVDIRAQLRYDLGPGGGDTEGWFDAAPDGGESVSVPLQLSPSSGLDRFAGAERVATSVAISVASFADGSAAAVVLARSDIFADAVVAAPLAVALDAPLLLTGQDTVSDAVLMEIQRALGRPGRVVLLGGTEAIRASVDTQLVSHGHTVERVAGASRFDTSTRIARATTPDPGVIFLADGATFPDALIAGAIASAFDGVVVLVSRDGIPAEVQAYLDAHPDAQRYAVGAVAAAADPDAPAAVGATPFATSAALATILDDPVEVVIASGEKFPDGLAGGAYAARRGAALLLTPTDALATSVLRYLEDQGQFDKIALLGGTSAISDAAAGQVAQFLRR